jgi:membrane protease YdiL (CAAX protease family)
MARYEQSHASIENPRLRVAAALYAVMLAAFWLLAQRLSLGEQVGQMRTTFAAFALLFAPFWFFGFGADQPLRRILTSRAGRVFAPGSLAIPYLLYAIPQGEFRWTYLCAFLWIPIGVSAMFEFAPPGGMWPASPKFCWQDAVALAAFGLPIEFNWFRGAFPHDGLDSLPKLLIVDAALYAFLVVRGLEGVGYDFWPRLRDLAVGLRELAFFAPIVISLGMVLGFIKPHAALPTIATVLSALLATFFLVAIPEELFFRGLLQSLLEARIGRVRALWLSAAIFGLSHFNKPGPFNWRYVLLATIAGVFYGRAWRDRRRLFPSATTHTLVDVLWTLWFRK